MINIKGYSVIELLVGVAVIGLIFGLSLSFYKNNNGKSFINEDAYLLKTNIIKTKNMAISGQSNVKYSENNSYGIYFNTSNNNQYFIYKDTNLNNRYDLSENIESISIDNSFINSLSSGSSLDLLFQTNGDIYLNQIKSLSGSISINLSNSSNLKSILFNISTSSIIIQ